MIRRWVRRLFLTALLGLIGLVTAGIALFHQIRDEVELMYAGEIAALEAYRPAVAVEVFDRYGAKIDAYATERRVWVPLADLPEHVWRAFLAAEDKRFLDHPGVDVKAILRAASVNLRAGEIREGGSTLTQQLAKNLVTGDERTYGRKVREALVAMELERQLTKAQLLELYLNQVYLGAGSYGVEAAAQRYFQKPAAQLDPGQAAMIAGLIPAPSTYNPEKHPEIAARRRREVLSAMVAEGWVAADLVPSLLDDPVRYKVLPPRDPSRGNAYRTMVRRELRRLFGDGDRIFQEGLKVYTPYDPAIQEVAEEAAWMATTQVQERQGYGGAVGHVAPKERETWLASGQGLPLDADGQPIQPRAGDCFRAMASPGLGELRAGAEVYRLRRADWGTRIHRGAMRGGGSLAGTVRAGDLVPVCLTEGGAPREVALDRTPWVQSAIVVLDNHTGGVVALVGGLNDALEGFVRAVQAKRQPGSTMKLFVYGTALRLGHSQLDIVQDAPIAFPGTNGRMWAPRNYDGGFFGPLPYRVALAFSRNVPAVRIAVEVGTDAIAETARLLGVRTPLRDDYTIALGSSELTPMDQAVAFSTVARLGVHRDPIYLAEILDIDDEVLGRAGDVVVLDDGTTVLLPGAPAQVIPSGIAYELADMLKAVMEIGTGARAKSPTHARYGKTGTTNNWTDAWFVGFNADYTTAVWVGTDTPVPLGERETGSKTALPAWQKVMDAIGEPSQAALSLPPDAVQLPYAHTYAADTFVGLARRNVPEQELPRPPVGREPLPGFPAPWPGQRGEPSAPRSAVGAP